MLTVDDQKGNQLANLLGIRSRRSSRARCRLSCSTLEMLNRSEEETTIVKVCYKDSNGYNICVDFVEMF